MSKIRLPVKPPLFGFLGEKALRRVLIGVLLTGLLAALVASTLWLQNVGREPTGSTTAGGARVPQLDKFRQEEFQELERRQLMRCGLREVDQRAEAIWKNIDIFETEAEAYHSRYKELFVSRNARRLTEDPWVVHYFWNLWGKRLPSREMGHNSREKLNELMVKLREAIHDPSVGYEPRQAFLDKIGQIEMEVGDACRAYNSHRRLMDALVGMIEDPKGGDQNTIKAKVDKLDAEQALLEHGYPGAKAESPRIVAPATAEETATKPGKQSSLDDLYEGVQRTRTGLPNNFGKTTLMRDAVPERRREATNDGPLYRPPASSPIPK